MLKLHLMLFTMKVKFKYSSDLGYVYNYKNGLVAHEKSTNIKFIIYSELHQLTLPYSGSIGAKQL